MNLRYVILHHTGIESPHFDLMFETAPGSKLATWRCLIWPILAPIQVERLADHRRAYLEYEGPVSGGRGELRRVAAGEFQLQFATENNLCFVLDQYMVLSLSLQPGSDLWLLEVGQSG